MFTDAVHSDTFLPKELQITPVVPAVWSPVQALSIPAKKYSKMIFLRKFRCIALEK